MSGTALIYEQMTCYKLLCESPSLLYIVNVYHCVKLTIGATLQLVDSVMTGRVRNGRALVRHHSQRSAAKGFCKHYNVKRVLIVAWDVHHGQTFLFSSECFWPNLRESDYDSVGKEKGAGFNSNVTWNKVNAIEFSFDLLTGYRVTCVPPQTFLPTRPTSRCPWLEGKLSTVLVVTVTHRLTVIFNSVTLLGID
uniref:Histone deacetylase domain-containing protein n=1 Tax=Salmo trutta TaxID=8032 RepID=A0A673WJL6_SALTR